MPLKPTHASADPVGVCDKFFGSNGRCRRRRSPPSLWRPPQAINPDANQTTSHLIRREVPSC
eukprot:2718435-Pyramimonas_sp.AAC.1